MKRGEGKPDVSEINLARPPIQTPFLCRGCRFAWKGISPPGGNHQVCVIFIFPVDDAGTLPLSSPSPLGMKGSHRKIFSLVVSEIFSLVGPSRKLYTSGTKTSVPTTSPMTMTYQVHVTLTLEVNLVVTT